MSTLAEMDVEDHPATNTQHEEDNHMKYKHILSQGSIREGEIDSRMVDGGSTGSITIGLEDNVALNLYMVSVNAGAGYSEDIIFGKLLDSETGFDNILGDRDALAEVSRKWPQFYGMLMAGLKDVYTDVAIIRLEDQLVLATKFDLDRGGRGDAMDYLSDKAALLLKGYKTISDEIKNNELSVWRVGGKRLMRAFADGWKGARVGRMIGDILGRFLGV